MTDYFFHNAYPVLLAAILLAWLGLAAWSAPLLAAALRPLVSRRGAAAAGAILAAALILRLGVLAPRHQVYFDEFLDQDVAANLSRDGTFAETLAAGLGKPPLLHLPSRPAGYHLLLAAVFKLSGVSEKAAFRLNPWLSAASVFFMYLLAALLFEDERAGLFSAFLLTALPVHLRFSPTTEITVCSGFWLLAALLALALYEKTRAYRAYLLLLVSLLYAANTRFENLLLAPFLAVVLGGLWRRRAFDDKTGYLAAPAAFFLLLVPAVGLFMHNRNGGLYGFNDPGAGLLRNLAGNLPRNIRYFFLEPATAAGLLPAAAVGALLGGRARLARILPALGSAYLLACSLHPSARFDEGPFERLALPIFLCLVAAAGGGLSAAGGRLGRPRLVGGVVAAAFVLLCLPYYGKGPPPRDEAEYGLVTRSSAVLPQDGYVLSYCAPLILVAAQRPAMAISIVREGGSSVLDALDARARPLIVFKDLWWTLKTPEGERLRNFESLLRRRYRFEPLKAEEIDSTEYGFYRLTRRGDAKRGR